MTKPKKEVPVREMVNYTHAQFPPMTPEEHRIKQAMMKTIAKLKGKYGK